MNENWQQEVLFGEDPILVEPKDRATTMHRVWRVCKVHRDAIENYPRLIFLLLKEEGLVEAVEKGPEAVANFLLNATPIETITRSYRKCRERGYIKVTKEQMKRAREKERAVREKWRG